MKSSVKTPENILLIRLGAMGDVIQTLPLLTQIRLNFPESQLHWIIEEKSLPLIKNQKNIEFIIFPKKEIFQKNPFKALAANQKLSRELKAKNFSVTIDPQGLFKSAWIAFLSGAPRRLGLHSKNSREGNFLFQTETLPFIPDGQMHRSDLFMQFVKLLGGTVQESSNLHNLYFSPQEITSGKNLLEDLQIKKPFFILNIGTSNYLKRWLPEHWAVFIRLLKQKYPDTEPVLTGGGKEDEKHLREITELTDSSLFTTVVNATSLRELMLLIRECRALISVDSLALHIGSACQKNCLGLFGGCAVASNTGPYQGSKYPKSLVLHSPIHCYPCRKKKCPHHSCMRDITPESAMNALTTLI
jgi:ADP-heptose:LPS heptosyltransferase